MTDETKSILMNTDVIAIDQDPAAKPVQLLTQEGKMEILDRPLQDGSVAVGSSIAATKPLEGSFAWKPEDAGKNAQGPRSVETRTCSYRR